MKAKNWIKEINENPDWNIVSIDQDAIDEISELIEKATPKKPTFTEEKFDSMFDDRVQVLVCPNCKRRMRYFYGVRYCPSCGQRLDWSEKDES